MTTPPGFTVDIDHNPYLPVNGNEVSAIVTVTADGSGDTPPPPSGGGGGGSSSAEIIIIDCSGSMDFPPAKMAEARAATAAAVDVVRDGTWFAIVAGTSTTWPVYPPDGSMAIASDRTRAEARNALRGLRANGGTAIGQWLRLARQIFQSSPATLRHAILLTDGKNQHETADELAAAISACEGVFRCDCRGVGTDWQVAELRKISTALLGTVDIVVDPAGLAADFEEMMRGAMSKHLPDVLLRVWTPQHAEDEVRQAGRARHRRPHRPPGAVRPAGGRLPDRRLGAGGERDYHVGIEVKPAFIGQQMLAARVSLVASSPEGEQVLGKGLIQVTWTDDEALSTRLNPRVASYTGQAELAAAIQDGLEARQQGDEETATARLGRAVALAHEAGNDATARLLSKVVDVLDEATGTVRLKKKVDAADEMALDTRSTKTVRVTKG